MPSPHSVQTTIERLEAVIARSSSISVLARIDQRALLGSASPMVMLLFENVGLARTLVDAHREAAFLLPIRALAWQDEAGAVWFRVTDPLDFSLATQEQLAIRNTIGQIEQILGAMVSRVLGTSPI
jgi:uncharacterized protein (DUF302 family)